VNRQFHLLHFHYQALPVNNLLALALQDHLDEMAKLVWELASAQQFINEHSATSLQEIFFWGKGRLAEESPK
jgi:hypothetical protein